MLSRVSSTDNAYRNVYIVFIYYYQQITDKYIDHLDTLFLIRHQKERKKAVMLEIGCFCVRKENYGIFKTTDKKYKENWRSFV